MTGELARVLEDEGCTVDEWRALALLADGRSYGMSALAEAVMVPAPSLTRLIDRMVADTLVYRTADATDRRRVLVRASARGQAVHGRLARRVEDERERILAYADADDAAALAVLLARLADGPVGANGR